MKQIHELLSFKKATKLTCFLFLVSCLSFSAFAADYDTEDPLFFEPAGDLTLRGGVHGGSDNFGADLRASYGVNDIFVASANVQYQNKFDDDLGGASNIGFNLMYRASRETVITDVFAGVRFGWADAPDFLDTVWSAGFRLGHQWNSFTLAGTFTSNWVFDRYDGLSYIDITPEAYFRLSENWRIGADFTFRKSTVPDFDQEWVGLKLVRQYGRTQYVGYGQYEFSDSDWRAGLRMNVFF